MGNAPSEPEPLKKSKKVSGGNDGKRPKRSEAPNKKVEGGLFGIEKRKKNAAEEKIIIDKFCKLTKSQDVDFEALHKAEKDYPGIFRRAGNCSTGRSILTTACETGQWNLVGELIDTNTLKVDPCKKDKGGGKLGTTGKDAFFTKFDLVHQGLINGPHPYEMDEDQLVDILKSVYGDNNTKDVFPHPSLVKEMSEFNCCHVI